MADLQSGNSRRAQAELDALVRDDLAAVPRDLFWLGAACLLAEAARALHHRAAARTLAARLEPHADRVAQIGLAVSVGPVRRFLALLAAELGQTDQARRHFEGALEMSRRVGAVTAEAHTQCEFAALLLGSGDSADAAQARDLLVSARATAERVGIKPLAVRATALLAPSRLGPRVASPAASRSPNA
jgi:tetratricopeptide (TPR) repeat protein